MHDEDTFAGVFRWHGYSVLNLGRSGSGPLLQLATLREYGGYVKPKSLIWYVFSGNDLRNLRVEKGTKLFAYLEDQNFSQRLLERRFEISSELKKFLNEQVERVQERRHLGIPYPVSSNHGQTLDVLEARDEIVLLHKVAENVLEYCRRRSIDLRIVVIEHPDPQNFMSEYPRSDTLQDITTDAITRFAAEANLPLMTIGRRYLEKNKSLLAKDNGYLWHFSPQGYRWAATEVLKWIALSGGIGTIKD